MLNTKDIQIIKDIVRTSQEDMARIFKISFDNVFYQLGSINNKLYKVESGLDNIEYRLENVEMRLDYAAYKFELVSLDKRVMRLENKQK